MQKVNYQIIKNDEPSWYFISECSLSGATLGEHRKTEPMTGSLFQSIQELGLPVEVVSRIEDTLIEITNETRGHFNYDGQNLPIYIRVFCQRKIIDCMHQPECLKRGGWGYYVIEGKCSPNASSQEFHRIVELYLYKEGE